MIPGHLPPPPTNAKESPKIPLVHFLIQDGPHHLTLFFEKKQGYTLIPHFAVRRKYLGVSAYVLRQNIVIQVIRNDSSTFFITKNPRWPPYCSKYNRRSFKKTKILGTGNCLVVESKMYFLAKPMESSTYLDHQYFIILN